jgi:chorismate mutase
MSDDSLDVIRTRLDTIDDQLVDLLGERFRLIANVSEVKQREGLDSYQPGREEAILKRVMARGIALGLNQLLLQAVFLQIFAVSKRQQEE